MAHVYLEGPTWIGEDNIFFPYQHRRRGVAGSEIQGRARRNPHRPPQPHPRVRHHPPRHRRAAACVTSIGSDNLLMAYTHVAHDVHIGDHVDPRQRVGAGRPRDRWRIGPIIGAFSGVHQFCRIGRHAFIGGYSVIKQDVLPFSTHQPQAARSKCSAPTRIGLGAARLRDRRSSRRCKPRSAC